MPTKTKLSIRSFKKFIKQRPTSNGIWYVVGVWRKSQVLKKRIASNFILCTMCILYCIPHSFYLDKFINFHKNTKNQWNCVVSVVVFPDSIRDHETWRDVRHPKLLWTCMFTCFIWTVRLTFFFCGLLWD